MRKVLAVLLALGGVVGAGQQAHAGPAFNPVPALDQPAQVQTVQAYDAWRYRQYRQQQRFERREFRRDNRRFQHNRGYGYGYRPQPGYSQFGNYGPHR